MVDGHPIAGVADPTHIQKAMRNAVYNNKEIEFDPKDVKEYNLPGSKVKWEHFQKVVDFDDQYQLGIAKHLKRAFVYDLGNFMRMKVPPARKVLSRATSVSIKMLHKRYPEQFPEEYLVTAFFCDIAGEWNDTINNREMSMAMVANNKKATEFRKGKIRKFTNIYIRMKLHKRQGKKLKDSQKGIILAMYSLFWITDKLLIELKFHFFLTAKGNTDVVEHLHSDARSLHTFPTPLDFKRDAKIMAVTHFSGHVKHSNYDIDETGFYLADLDSIKDMVAEEEKDDSFVIDLAKAEFFAPPDWLEKSSLAMFGGWVLKVTIVLPAYMKRFKPSLRTTKCDVCIKAFVLKYTDDDQEVNDFIQMREYKKGALVHPTVMANEMFLHAEKIFRAAWKLLPKHKNLNEKLTSKVVSACSGKFEQLPLCHLERILGKFVEVRLHFYADYIDGKLQKISKRAIINSANASKSTKAATLTRIPDKAKSANARKRGPRKSTKAATLTRIPDKAKKARKGKVGSKKAQIVQEPDNVQEPESVVEPEIAQVQVRKPGTARKRKFPTKGYLDKVDKKENESSQYTTKRSKRMIKKPSRFLDAANETTSDDLTVKAGRFLDSDNESDPDNLIKKPNPFESDSDD